MERIEDILLSAPNQFQQLVDSIGIAACLEHEKVAQLLTYYQRYLSGEYKRHLNNRFKSRLSPDRNELPSLEKFSTEEKGRIFRHLGAFQLTYGCSGGCNFCGLDADSGKKEHVPFPVLRYLVQTYREQLQNSEPFFYYASDPLDYESQEDGQKRTYYDVLQLLDEVVELRPFTSTIVPNGSDEVFWSIVRDDRFVIDRLSIVGKRHKDSLNLRKMLGLGNARVEDEYRVDKLNIGKFGEDNMQKSDIGIGCFNGMLLTPRGVYSVVQNQGFHSETPQRQFVVPYCGGALTIPSVGDDVRNVLARHIPLLDQSFGTDGINEAHKMHKGEHGQQCFAIKNPCLGEEETFSIVTFKDSIVTEVEPYELYLDLATLYLHESVENRYRNKSLGLGYALSMAKYATIAVKLFDPEVPPDESALNSYLNTELNEKEMNTIFRTMLMHPHWALAYMRLFRTKYPNAKVEFNAYLIPEVASKT